MNPPILVLGYANADLVARVSYLPKDGERVTAEYIDLVPGGMAANCACAAARQGGQVIFFGSVADDPLGQFLLDDLTRHQVDVSFVNRQAPRTTKALILVSPGGERAIISEPVIYDPAPLRRFLQMFDAPPGALYLDGYHLGAANREAGMAKEKGFIVYCDLDGAPDTHSQHEMLRALTNVDIVQWNPGVASRIFPALPLEAAERELGTFVETVITTRGAESVRIFTRSAQHSELSVPVIEDVCDTTGAGDTFAGTFLSTYVSTGDRYQAARFAISAASEATRYAGARPVKAANTR